jgi:adenosylhomocysteinase
MDGFEVMPMQEAARYGDIFITVTGNINVIRHEHFAVMKNNAILSNAGHFDVEVSKGDLYDMAVSTKVLKNNIEEFVMPDGRKLYLLAEGRLVNLAAGDGHPAEVMDLSFSLQALSLIHVIQNRSSLGNHVYNVPEKIDKKVALLKLKSSGIAIDELTTEQKEYLDSWDTNL